ncbi:putative S-layer protein [Rivularia sp. PCC 7116]|uniref:S-layer homology domain-containing protein n=1 Tax=Rivularia sp. PCC 7116 TaxID=373994 RepID=UPI00029EFF29|nr:S-layer homology domain-containing protein [Rivularia sp. PCC 7116]AFY57893.1 putative S-layer protein [Rivularia sp. PCC 7116]
MVNTSTSFPDIKNHWARKFIEALATRRILNGYPDGSFRPNYSVTRAEFAAIITSTFYQIPKKREYIPFVDVPASHWAFSAIKKSYETVFISGFPNREFRPANRITRANALVSIISGLGFTSSVDSDLLSFLPQIYQDYNQIPEYAKIAMAISTKAGLVASFPDIKLLNPTLAATRADISAFVYQALVYLEQAEKIESEYLISSQLSINPDLDKARKYDIICFGDEVPGVLSLVCASREYNRRTGKYPRSLLLFKGNSQLGIGGHLVRGGLSYLDRSAVPISIRRDLDLDTFGDSPAIYDEFLQRSGVYQIALNPQNANLTLRQMLQEVKANILSNAEIKSVVKYDKKIAAIELVRDEVYTAKHFIDCTVNAELAQFAGVKKLKGFATFGLPDSELSVTLTFQTKGLSVEKLKRIEYEYLEGFTNPANMQFQNLLNIAAGNNSEFADYLRQGLIDGNGNLKTMYAGKDYIDVRSKALSIAYHSFRGTPLSLQVSGSVLDNGNIAILDNNTLSWNALLFDVNADKAETLARKKALPTAGMLQEMESVAKWFKNIGALEVVPASELYIRHAGNILGAVKPLTGAEMLAGGVPENQALGTFGYHFDIRGGVAGLIDRSSEKGLQKPSLHLPPLFNFGVQHALVKDVPNLAVISPASGFKGYASSAGRIVEFNCGVGQGVGIGIGIALSENRNLAEISNLEVREVLVNTQRLPKIYGVSYIEQARELDVFENLIA